MNSYRIRAAALLACLALGPAGQALAHELNGSLRIRATAKDTLLIECTEGDASTQLFARVSDQRPKFPPRLQLTITKNGQTQTAIDPIDADGKFSPQITVQGGQGTYTVSIEKLPRTNVAPLSSRAYAELYLLEFHCYTSGDHTQTNISYAPGGNQ
jgi:hypothetical protein